MRVTSHDRPRVDRPMNASAGSGVIAGLIGGLLGTVVMDLFGAGLFVAMGAPATLSFAVIGDAAAGFGALLGIALAGGAPLGVLLHYLIGLGLGAIFGAAVSQLAPLRALSTWRGVGLAVLFVEVMSQPLLAAAALLLHMTAAEAAQWFGISFVMHLVYGLVLGLIVYRYRGRGAALPPTQG